MENKILVRLYLSGDEEGIVEVLERGFNGWPPFDITCSKVEHWKWKYLESPGAGKNYLRVATFDEKIIGTNFGYNLKVWMKDKSFVGRYGSDLTVHPDFRRRGVWNTMRNFSQTELGRAMLEEIDVSHWVSSNPLIIERSIKRGRHRFPHVILNMARINDFNLHLLKTESDKILVKKAGYNILKLINESKRISSIPFSNEKIVKDNGIRTVTLFDEKIDDFYKSIRHKYSFIVERDKSYLNWRYCDPRAGNYVIRVLQEEDEILGYCVLRINLIKPDYPRGKIVDVLSKNSQVTEALIRDAIEFFDKDDINHIGTWAVKSSQHEKILSKYGFLDMKNDLVLFTRSPNNSLDYEPINNSKQEQVHFQYGDTDNI